MKEVLSINKAVSELLKARPFVNDVMTINAINYSGLARHLLPQLQTLIGKKTINIESVIMAIKRYVEKAKKESLSKKIMQALSKCDVRLRGYIVDLTLKRTQPNYARALDAYKKIDWVMGDIMYIYQSLTEIAVILDRKNIELIKVSENEVTHQKEDLAMLTLRTPKEIIDMPGVYHFVLGLLAAQGIAITDIVSTYTELVLIVNEEDGAKTYNILSDMIKKARE